MYKTAFGIPFGGVGTAPVGSDKIILKDFEHKTIEIDGVQFELTTSAQIYSGWHSPVLLTEFKLHIRIDQWKDKKTPWVYTNVNRNNSHLFDATQQYVDKVKGTSLVFDAVEILKFKEDTFLKTYGFELVKNIDKIHALAEQEANEEIVRHALQEKERTAYFDREQQEVAKHAVKVGDTLKDIATKKEYKITDVVKYHTGFFYRYSATQGVYEHDVFQGPKPLTKEGKPRKKGFIWIKKK